MINSENVPVLEDLFILREYSQSLLLKVNLRSTFGNKFLQPATYVFCCAKSSSRKVKNARHRPKTYNETMLRDKLRAFVSRVLPPLLCMQIHTPRHICMDTRAKYVIK